MKTRLLAIISILGTLGILGQPVSALEVVTVYGQQYNFLEDWYWESFTWENEWGDTFERDLAYEDYLEAENDQQCEELELEKPDGCYGKPDSVTQTIDGWTSIKYSLAVAGYRTLLNDALIAAGASYAASRSNTEAADAYWSVGNSICQNEYSSIVDVTSCLYAAYEGSAGLSNTWELEMPFTIGGNDISFGELTIGSYGPAFFDLIDSTMACMAWHNLFEMKQC